MTLLVWDQEVRGGQNAAMTQLNKNFQKKYPDIKINRVAKSFTDLQATLKLAASGPNPPDVIEVNNGYSSMGPLVKAGLLLNLNKYAGKYGWNTRYSTGLLKMNKFTSDGEQLRHREPLRPADDGRGRGRLLQQGQAEEARPEGADDVPAVRGGGVEGAGRGRDADPVREPRQVAGHPRVRGAHAPERHEDSGRATGSSARAAGRSTSPRRARSTRRTKLQQWAKSGSFTKGYEGLGYDPSWADFGKGKGVFLISGSWLTADLKKALGKDVGFFLLPPPSGKQLATLGGEGLPWAISSKSKNADAAATYLDFITNNCVDAGRDRQRQPLGDEGQGQGAVRHRHRGLQRLDEGELARTRSSPTSTGRRRRCTTRSRPRSRSCWPGKATPQDFANKVNSDYSKFHNG